MVRTIRRGYFGVLAVLAALALLCVTVSSSEADAGDTTRVSVDSSGAQGNGESGASYRSSMSPDGRFVAFESEAANLVPGDTNNAMDVFVHDRTSGTTERVSLDSSENQESNAWSQAASISADGRYVAFLASSDSNLVEGDTNNVGDVFVRDRIAGVTKRVSVDSSGEQANDTSFEASISDNGRYVVFCSAASNLVEDDTNDTWDCFVHDLQTGTTERVSVDSSENQANHASWSAHISADGRYVAFGSFASNLAAGDTNGSEDVFVRDLQTGTTERVSVNSSGTQAYYGGFDPSISADGRYVTFTSQSKNLIPPGFWRESNEVFVHDRTARTTEWVSKDRDQSQPDGNSWGASISSDGRYVTFSSDASDMVAGGDTNGVSDAFVRDLQTGTTERVSVTGCGNGANGESYSGSISDDGRYVAFGSFATNLVVGDTNDTWDVFVRDRQTEPAQSSDCIAPTTTASAITSNGATYHPGTWTNQNVTVTLSAQDDEGGSGIRDIRYSATGADAISQQTVAADLPATLTIDAEGTTTISYFATDNAGYQESPPKTLTVNIDKSAPGVDSASPANAATGISLTANAEATFTEAMDPNTISPSTFTVTKQGSSTPLAATVSYNPTTNKATLDPSSDLASNTTYVATIKGGSTGAKDSAGNALAQDHSWTFTTGPPPDTTAPKVSTATPTGTGVARGSNAIATFSERMDPTTITTSTFKLFKCSSTNSTNCATQITNVALTKSTDRLKATLNPYGTSSTLLAGRTKYKVVVTTGAKDEAGNQLDQDTSTAGNQNMVWYFTTGRS